MKSQVYKNNVQLLSELESILYRQLDTNLLYTHTFIEVSIIHCCKKNAISNSLHKQSESVEETDHKCTVSGRGRKEVVGR